MQKTLEILEKNVQWIVLGLAALFLLWVAYAYVLTPPATVKIGPRVVTAGEVAEETAKSAKDLDRQIKENRPISFPTPDLVTSWREHMAAPFAVALAAPDFNSQPQGTIWLGPGVTGAAGPRITVLPTPPAPQVLPVATGVSTVIPQAPNQPNQPINPNNGNPPPAPNIPVAAPQPKDTDWITVPAVIQAAALKQALLAPFGNAQPNPALGQLYNTTLLRIELERQESTGNDNGMPVFPPGDSGITPIAALTADQPLIQAIPKDKETADLKYQYIQWAQQNQALLTSPAFYQVTAGDPWAAPQLPPPPTPGGAAPGAGNPGAAPLPPQRPVLQPNQPFVQPQPNGNAAAGVINPFNLVSDILIWAIDDTAQPGHTYRYRIRYVIKNPVFAIQNMAPNQLLGQLPIESPPSNWSDPVKAPPMTKFWVAGIQGSHASLDVFQYAQGDWKAMKSMPANPGDAVPGTDLTMVDVRSADTGHGRDKYVLLTTDRGEMIRRDATADEADPDHQAMLNPTPNPANNPRPGPVPPPNVPPFGGRPPLRNAVGH